MVTATSERIATLQIFGRPCPRCQARNRQGLQCGKAAIRGKRVCRNHGGASRGPSMEGRLRIAKARTIHGDFSKELVAASRADKARLRVLEGIAHELGLVKGPRIRGRKPSSDNPSVEDMKGVIEALIKAGD